LTQFCLGLPLVGDVSMCNRKSDKDKPEVIEVKDKFVLVELFAAQPIRINLVVVNFLL
jgi:hypothetical protein